MIVKLRSGRLMRCDEATGLRLCRHRLAVPVPVGPERPTLQYTGCQERRDAAGH